MVEMLKAAMLCYEEKDVDMAFDIPAVSYTHLDVYKRQGAAFLSASAIIVILLFVGIKGIAPFLPGYANGQVNAVDFLLGTTWRQDQGIYGVGYIIINTLISSFGALLLAFPISVLTALFIAKIAPKSISQIMSTVVELLASIPSVVYGVFAAGSITALVKMLASQLGIVTAGGSSLLAVILLLAIMIFPTITSMAVTAIRSVDKEMELGSLALGATQTQTNFKVILSSAKSGIFAGAILGIGRAFGEATAVSYTHLDVYKRQWGTAADSQPAMAFGKGLAQG